MMVGTPLLLVLLALSCLSLAGMVVSGVLVSRMQDQRRRRDARLKAVSAPFRPVVQIELSAFKPMVRARRPLMATLAALLGIDVVRTDQYPAPWWMIVACLFVVVGFLSTLISGFLGLLTFPAFVGGWIMACRAVFGWMLEKRRDNQLQQFPDALAMIVRSVGVGIPVMEAMRSVAREASDPTGPEFARMIEQVSIGVPMEDSLREMATRSNLAEYRFFATALALQAQTGGSLSGTLIGLADVIRKRLALKARGHALSSEARASAMVLGGLPVALGLMLWLMNPAYIDLLFVDPMGRAILGGACASLCCGVLAMRTIIRRTLS
ncbi:type II secretion system protein F [Gluconacetobacter azotocaptans]|uniref:Type II secretion system protein F n=1 Tax=Gluconacetobacter azotocaptans TaxID=142834 RepID=A0A7W4JVM7_9PROT|nr:type II secretion system F family protein [Gluconacetobacter azotocaptans]MBB2191734.1 type II secretion system protein F [Gluconacetobacter azotocaptans]GBQ34226.1 Flp pilus assembly protein TadB [Gluconacetobacter azotocaptans DSM 13594]